MLNIVPPLPPDHFGEARALLRLVESGRSSLWAVFAVVLLLLAAGCLVAGAVPLGGLLIGAASSLALCRYGPSWWPGRR